MRAPAATSTTNVPYVKNRGTLHARAEARQPQRPAAAAETTTETPPKAGRVAARSQRTAGARAAAVAPLAPARPPRAVAEPAATGITNEAARELRPPAGAAQARIRRSGASSRSSRGQRPHHRRTWPLHCHPHKQAAAGGTFSEGSAAAPAQLHCNSTPGHPWVRAQRSKRKACRILGARKPSSHPTSSSSTESPSSQTRMAKGSLQQMAKP